MAAPAERGERARHVLDAQVTPRHAVRHLARSVRRRKRGCPARAATRCLVATSSVVEGDKPSWKLAAGLDKLQVGLGDIVRKKRLCHPAMKFRSNGGHFVHGVKREDG